VSQRMPDRGSFEDLLRLTKIEAASLVCLSRHPATEPYWSAGGYLFDDPDPGGANALGTCYTASTIEVAFAESVIGQRSTLLRHPGWREAGHLVGNGLGPDDVRSYPGIDGGQVLRSAATAL
jgi:hypothetical protein